MNTLVLHHTYAQGTAFDISNNRNHGTPIKVVPGTGALAPSFEFSDPDARIDVSPSPTLTDLRQIRAVVRFRIGFGQGQARRLNLMEGFTSFALYVEADRALTGTIVDAAGQWRGASTRPGLLKTPGRWHVAELLHDGVSRVTLVLDGAVVAVADGVRGPVRSVGPLGIAIGHWPDPPSTYTFHGHIGETRLYAYDPAEEARRLATRCCMDQEALAAETDRLVKDGWTRDGLMDLVDELVALGMDAVATARESGAANAEAIDRTVNEAMAALMRGDADGLRRAYARTQAQRSTLWTQGQLLDFESRGNAVLEKLPIDARRAAALAKAVCLEHAVIGDVADLVERERPPDDHPRPGRPKPKPKPKPRPR